MSGPVDRRHIEQLLQDSRLSFRAIAREVGCSDWTVRRIARELEDDPRPMKGEWCEPPGDASEGSEIAGWIGLAAFVGFIALTFWFAWRNMPPPQA